MPELTPEQNQAFARVLTHADRLFEALEDLAAAGGLRGLSGRIKPTSLAKAAAGLRSVRQAIDEQLAGFAGGPTWAARPGGAAADRPGSGRSAAPGRPGGFGPDPPEPGPGRRLRAAPRCVDPCSPIPWP